MILVKPNFGCFTVVLYCYFPPHAAVIDVKSSKTQTAGGAGIHAGVSALPTEGGAPRQYYFSPTMGYVPLTASASGELD